MLRLVSGEAMAYLRLGWVSRQTHLLPEQHGRTFGVLFVPGVGANGAHFLAMKRALQTVGVDRFDAFEYKSLRPPRELGRELRQHIQDLVLDVENLLLIGHSLGGVLLRIALQGAPRIPDRISGFVTICSPHYGTRRSKLSPSPALRELAPDSSLIAWLHATLDRLEPLLPTALSIGVVHDQLICPSESSLLEGTQQLRFDGVAHAGSVLDARVIRTVRDHAALLIAENRPKKAPPAPLPTAAPQRSRGVLLR